MAFGLERNGSVRCCPQPSWPSLCSACSSVSAPDDAQPYDAPRRRCRRHARRVTKFGRRNGDGDSGWRAPERGPCTTSARVNGDRDPTSVLWQFVVLLIAGLAVGCTNSPGPSISERAVSTTSAERNTGPSASTSLPGEQSLDCSDAITATPSLDKNQLTYLGRFGLSGGAADRALQTARSSGEDSTRRLWSKSALFVHGDDPVDLMVPPGEDYWIGWGNPASPSKSVSVHGCTGDVWTIFSGGFWTDHPRCVELIVRAGQAEIRLGVGLGTPCPGQLAPAGPTEG